MSTYVRIVSIHLTVAGSFSSFGPCASKGSGGDKVAKTFETSFGTATSFVHLVDSYQNLEKCACYKKHVYIRREPPPMPTASINETILFSPLLSLSLPSIFVLAMIAIADKADSLLVLDIRACVCIYIYGWIKRINQFSRYKSLQAFLSSVEMEEMGADLQRWCAEYRGGPHVR